MARYDVVVIGAGLGGLTAGAILARAGRKVLVIERSNSVGGAASSYKSGDLFVEGSLHETSDPHDPRDPKHGVLVRAGVLDAVKWIPGGGFYEVRGGPLDRPFAMPDNFDAARRALTDRFPQSRGGIHDVLDDMERLAAAAGEMSGKADDNPDHPFGALVRLITESDRSLSLAQKFERVFGNDEAVKCALAANLSYYHDDPTTLSWPFFAMSQGGFFLSGGRYVQGGSQRLSSALARAIRTAGGEVMIRRVVTCITLNAQGLASGVTHTAKDGGDSQTVESAVIVSNAAPEILASLMPADSAGKLTGAYARQRPSISLFALTLGLSKPPREFGVASYSTQLLPPWMTRLGDYAQGAPLMAGEPADRMPPFAIVDYAAIDAGVPAPPYVLSIFGPDRLSNWENSDLDFYRDKRARWQDAIARYLDRHYPGLAGAVTASSFNTALSVRQYLNAPGGAVYGFAPMPQGSVGAAPHRSPRTAVPGLYLSSAYAGFGGYTGVIQSAGACADMILRESKG
jgi:phytoene dehydrogenase-like protein